MKETMQESVEQDSEGTAAHQQDDGTLQPKKAATSAAPIWESFLFFFMVGLLAWGSLALTLMVYQALVRPLAVVPYPHILLSANLLSSGVGITLLLSYRRFYASYQALEERLRKREEEFSHQFHVASITDRLTGLCTLFYFGQRVDEEMERAWRYKHPFVLLVIDLMDFSAINERHGRLSGDLVLRQFAQSVIKGVIRTTDLSARYGGDQFAILLPETGAEGGHHLADRLRQRMDQEIVLPSGHPLDIAIGVVSFPQDGVTREGLLRLADERLKTDKARGTQPQLVGVESSSLLP